MKTMIYRAFSLMLFAWRWFPAKMILIFKSCRIIPDWWFIAFLPKVILR